MTPSAAAVLLRVAATFRATPASFTADAPCLDWLGRHCLPSAPDAWRFSAAGLIARECGVRWALLDECAAAWAAVCEEGVPTTVGGTVERLEAAARVAAHRGQEAAA